jgi:hypothetical protein
MPNGINARAHPAAACASSRLGPGSKGSVRKAQSAEAKGLSGRCEIHARVNGLAKRRGNRPSAPTRGNDFSQPVWPPLTSLCDSGMDSFGEATKQRPGHGRYGRGPRDLTHLHIFRGHPGSGVCGDRAEEYGAKFLELRRAYPLNSCKGR